MEPFGLPAVAIPKRQLSYTLNRLKQETKIWQHLEQFSHTHEEEKKII